MGVCWDVVDLEGLQTVPYRTDCLGIVMHRDHALAGRAGIDFRHTLAYEHIGKRPSTIFQAALIDCAERVGKAVRYRAVVSSFDAAIRLAHSGLGIAVVPREAATSFSRFEEVSFVPLSDAWAVRRFVLCAQDFSRLQPAARMLADYLTQQCRARAEQTTDRMERTFA
jgi:DNA-binding transcriptional LysR family regulator